MPLLGARALIQLKAHRPGQFPLHLIKAEKVSAPSSSAAATWRRSAVRVPRLAVVCRDSSRARSKAVSDRSRNWKRPPARKSASKLAQRRFSFLWRSLLPENPQAKSIDNLQFAQNVDEMLAGRGLHRLHGRAGIGVCDVERHEKAGFNVNLQ